MNSSENQFLNVKAELLQFITTDQAWFYRIIPKNKLQDSITFYTDKDPSEIQDELELILGINVYFDSIESDLIQKNLSKYYRKQEKNKDKSPEVLSSGSDDFIINLIAEAKSLKSSDIHIETYEERCRVRIRIDGMMVERFVLNKEEYPSVVNKIKILANLDIAEKRLPQDGRIFFNQKGNKFDIRVSVLPTLHGEKVVMRLLSNDSTKIDIRKLGFSDFDLDNYLEGIKKPNGMLLISGPTGSGKTTTLYATLKLLNEETRNVLTIEDPIEYTLEGINQVQLRENIGFTFGSALRTFLRQDPDVIMVGEIRDPDTASMAVRASLTGHLVLSTIHTNSAWGTVSRLADMGVPPFLLANTLNTTVAQRLVRLLCPSCKEFHPFTDNLYPKTFRPFEKVEIHGVAKGCEDCFYTGYKGRKAVYEVIPVDYELADKIKNGIFDISKELKERKIRTLAENAFELFQTGHTSIEEIYPLLLNF
jgi:type IV pilus assembly protein PilB